MSELNERLAEFEKRGISVIVVSMDDETRARKQRTEWSTDRLTVGYGLSEADAKAWGLFISRKAKVGEPERFAEPGIAIVSPDGMLYAIYLQSVPFARPRIDDLLAGLDFVVEKNYPPRGTVETDA